MGFREWALASPLVLAVLIHSTRARRASRASIRFFEIILTHQLVQGLASPMGLNPLHQLMA